jgi:hypothetical protein
MTELQTLGNKVWIDGLVLDFWLAHLWLRLRRPSGRYIRISEITTLNNPTPDQIIKFRQLYELPPIDKQCPLYPLTGFINTGTTFTNETTIRNLGNHYCSFYYDPYDHIFHLIGFNYSRNQVGVDEVEWEEFGGDRVWRVLCILHGWDYALPKLKNVDWVQNGYDCGPIVAQVLEHIWRNGFLKTFDGFWKKTTLPCAHRLRIQMANEIHNHVIRSYTAYRDNPPLQAHFISANPLEDALQQLENNPGEVVKSTVEGLKKAILRCRKCNTIQPNPDRTNPITKAAKQAKGISGRQELESEIEEETELQEKSKQA